MFGIYREPIRKKISMLKLHISTNTAILTVDDQIIIESLLKIDENFTIFRNFFEILKTSSIEKVFLINLDLDSDLEKEFQREISGIYTNFEVKHVIFDENSATNVVIWIINKCNQLNGVFMRGFMSRMGDFHTRYLYETMLPPSGTVQLAENINNLKRTFAAQSMRVDYEELKRKKISTLKLEFSSKTAILTVDNTIILENPLIIDENFTIFQNFFEILKTSIIGKMFLVNLNMNSELDQEFRTKISEINTDFYVKNVIFDEKSTTNVVISIINKCNQLNGVFMRGFMVEKDNFQSRFFYEVKLVRSEIFALKRKIEELKNEFGKYELETETFAQFLMNFTENSPVGTEIFMETPFGKEKSEKVYKNLQSITNSGSSCLWWDNGEELVARWTENWEKKVILKFRRFGVYCTIQDDGSQPKCKKPKIQPQPLFPMQNPNILIDEDHSIEKYLENVKELTESKMDWNDLPIEMKYKCIENMNEKTKAMLRSCSKSDQNIVDNEKKHFKMLEFKDLIRYRSRFGDVFGLLHRRMSLITIFETSCSIIDSSGEPVVFGHLKYFSDSYNERNEKKRLSLYKLLSRFLENSRIDTLKIETLRRSEWWKIYSENGREPKKVENFELKSRLPYDEMYEMSMKLNAKSIRLIGDNYVCFNEFITIIQKIVKQNWEIGRKIELSPIQEKDMEEKMFGSQGNAENLADQLNIDLVSNDEKHFRLALKQDPNKHIVILYIPNKSVQLVVISKDLTEIPDSFF